MSLSLSKLLVRGDGKQDAELDFLHFATLIRGPSDTGKSYIRDCLWYMLGGDKVPKELPEGTGYDTIFLEVKTGLADVFTFGRSVFGGATSVWPVALEFIDTVEAEVKDDLGALLVMLAGAQEKQILRSASKKGAVTGGDLRHWSLISQPAMISEEPHLGGFTEQTQRKSAFYLFLTGQDDSSVVLAVSKDVKIRAQALIEAAQRDIDRISKELPTDLTSDELVNALHKVDAAFDVLSSQQKERSVYLKGIREEFNIAFKKLRYAEARLANSKLMSSRFELLDQKYVNDLERLHVVSEGVAIFSILPVCPCVLCGSNIGGDLDAEILAPNASARQHAAIVAEVRKILDLRFGLAEAKLREDVIVDDCLLQLDELKVSLEEISTRERKALRDNAVEFSVNPKELAEKRSEYTEQIKLFSDLDRLTIELGRLKSLVPAKKKTALVRHTGTFAAVLNNVIHQLLREWGFLDISNVDYDSVACDIKINGRARLSYGAGKRAIFLSALSVGLMSCALDAGYPHLGVVVLDSPVKSYSDPNHNKDLTIAPSIVKDSFYSWLSSWNGPGQVIVLENEPVNAATAKVLRPIEFSGVLGVGRKGFYPG
jgi:hypothetical protein